MQPLCSLGQLGCLQVQCGDGKAAGMGWMLALVPPQLLWGWMGAVDPVLMGPSSCGKLVLPGERCFIHIHLHACLCISSTPFQPASDPGWKAIDLTP